MSALSFFSSVANFSNSYYINSEEKEAVESTLQYKLEKVVMNLSDFDSEDPFYDTRFPSLNYEYLAGVVGEFDGYQVVEKANKAYSWVITSGQHNEKQYFLVTDRLLGSGSHGEVYHGFTHHGEPCAVKIGKVKVSEVEYLQRLSKFPSEQSSVNRLLAADHEQGVVVMELAHSTISEVHHLSPQKKLSPQETSILMRGILSGLKQIANEKIVHSDIKPENIFVIQRDGYLAAKIGDFGLSIQVGDRFVGGTRHFYAPEVFYHFRDKTDLCKDEEICKLDMWSTMLVFGEFAEDLMSQEFRNRFKDYKRKVESEIRFATKKPIGQRAPEQREVRKILSHHMVVYFNQILCKRDGLFSDLTPKTPLDGLMQKMAIIYPRERISAEGALKACDGLRPTPSDDLELPLFEEISNSSESLEEIDH